MATTTSGASTRTFRPATCAARPDTVDVSPSATATASRPLLRLCSRCGLGFLSPRLTPPSTAPSTRDVYRPLVSAYHGRRIDAETVQVEQRGYADELVAFLRETLPAPPATVLDVGGSTGIVAAAVRGRVRLARRPCSTRRPDELEVAAAAGMETIAGFAEDFDPGDRRWDLVLLCQTIDHLLDVAATLGLDRAG